MGRGIQRTAMSTLRKGLISILFLLCAAGATTRATSEGGPDPFDVLIVNARIVDGSGAPAFLGDIGVRDGRVARIGALRGWPASRVFDATGLVATPGFIDLHVHVEDSLADDPDAGNLVA